MVKPEKIWDSSGKGEKKKAVKTKLTQAAFYEGETERKKEGTLHTRL